MKDETKPNNSPDKMEPEQAGPSVELELNEATARHILEKDGVKYTPQTPILAYCLEKSFKITKGNKSLIGTAESYIVLEGDSVTVKDKEAFDALYKRRYKKTK